MTPEQKIAECTHSPIYDKQTGGSKCKKCGVLLNDFNQEYPEVKEYCNDSGGDSPLNTAHPPTSELISDLEAYAAMYENLKAEYETIIAGRSAGLEREKEYRDALRLVYEWAELTGVQSLEIFRKAKQLLNK